MRLLLIEDSARLRELVTETVREAGWRIDAFGSAAEGRLALDAAAFDLVLLDLGLPDEDGLDLLRGIRKGGCQMPVLVLTARGAVDERIAGLDAGADDYLVKPFNNGELLARIRALLRRAPSVAMPVLEFAGLRFDVQAMAARCGDEDLPLAPSERSLLELLMRNGGKVVPKRRIEGMLSEFGDEKSANAVELAVSRLRRKLEGRPTGTAIETIRGVGYLLREARP
ncbi:two-component system, OmpR family, response regulator TctD [Pseudoxanthobacter soli DSM 19599]|uniref:Two-component system, OmpR family, response regulator TctD n=1 Tax=Pseudoxanthobacter soli DSM 19599 TaxID=1123029 RepID=A0A1M7ZRG5_9HYPH|nr:response regulator transcription factor [Pseudoxanthobacter soli]SHO67500.1 two-component system, OmpR family, response regulator TctD [Pseudoxanthobacter soli DSM 19599]